MTLTKKCNANDPGATQNGLSGEYYRALTETEVLEYRRKHPTKRIPKPATETRLARVVRYWLNNQGTNYPDGWRGAYKDLAHGGCVSGIVSKLIYYTDTVKFYRKHQEEISALVTEMLRDTGNSLHELFGEKWDVTDPLAQDTHNQNLLAWFGFEEMARRIAEANGEGA